MPTLFKPDQAHRLPAAAETVDRDGKPHIRLREGGRTVYYPLASNGKKYLKPSPKWPAEIRQTDGTRKRLSLSANRAAAERMLADLMKGIEEQKAGIRAPSHAEAARPLRDHLTEWESSAHCVTT